MNVVPVHAADTLPIIYERGLVGIYHDWCEPFSTYPRSYDLLHADHLFSRLKIRYAIEKQPCFDQEFCCVVLICSVSHPVLRTHVLAMNSQVPTPYLRHVCRYALFILPGKPIIVLLSATLVLCRCRQPVAIVVEMDRILRPGGWAIIRDKLEILDPLETILKSLHWEIVMTFRKDKEGIMSVKKTTWRP